MCIICIVHHIRCFSSWDLCSLCYSSTVSQCVFHCAVVLELAREERYLSQNSKFIWDIMYTVILPVHSKTRTPVSLVYANTQDSCRKAGDWSQNKNIFKGSPLLDKLGRGEKGKKLPAEWVRKSMDEETSQETIWYRLRKSEYQKILNIGQDPAAICRGIGMGVPAIWNFDTES